MAHLLESGSPVGNVVSTDSGTGPNARITALAEDHLNPGTVYAAQDDASPVYRYNADTNTWTATGWNLPTATSNNATGVVVAGHYVVGYIAGPGGESQATVGAVRLSDGAALTFGNVGTGRKLVAADPHTGRLWCAVVNVSAGQPIRLYRIDLPGNTTTTLASTGAPSGSPGWGGLAYDAKRGQLYLLPGNNTTDAFAYDIASNAWRPLPAAPSGIVTGVWFDHGADRLYAVGGGYSPSKVLEQYDPAANTWLTPRAPIPGGSGDENLTVVNLSNGTRRVLFVQGEAAPPTVRYWPAGTWTRKALGGQQRNSLAGGYAVGRQGRGVYP